MSFDTAICNGIIISPHNDYQPLIGSIGISNGFIDYVGEKNFQTTDAKEFVDASGKIVMPGLINGHCHADMTMARGMGDDLTLQEQNNFFGKINWFSQATTIEDRFYSRMLTYIEAIMSGTTFILDNTFWTIGKKAFEAMSSVGIKGGIVQDFVTDFQTPDEMLSIEALMDFKFSCVNNKIKPVFGGLLEESYEPSRLEKVKDLTSKLNCLITSHLCETTWRKELLEQKFHRSSVQLLEQFGLITDKYIGSHAIYLSKQDIEILYERNAKIVNTPLCEMKIADGIAPIPDLVKKGIVVGLGTDGAMWNNSNDIFREMKGMALLQTVSSGIRSLSTKSILDMATINGAKVFGLEKEIGSIEVGKKADIILVDTVQPHMAPIRTKNNVNVCSALVFCATGRDVTDVFIDGNHIVRNRKLLTVHVKDIINRVSEISEKIGALI
jgi:5-methylthioadenosine/S-adenosylhomocysteine deaminase